METGDEKIHKEFQADAPQMFKEDSTNPSSLGTSAKKKL